MTKRICLIILELNLSSFCTACDQTEWGRSPSNDLSYHISCWSKAVLNEAKTSQKFCGCPEKDSLYLGAFCIIFDIYRHLDRIIHSQKKWWLVLSSNQIGSSCLMTGYGPTLNQNVFELTFPSPSKNVSWMINDLTLNRP